jgi:DNA-binding NarL/FixJ family response regulator
MIFWRPQGVFTKLSKREREVAGLAANGRSNTEIARELNLVESTRQNSPAQRLP